MNTYELWTLAVCFAGTGEEPYASLHSTYDDARKKLRQTFGLHLAHLADDATEEQIAAALDEVAYFTIEPAIIDTDSMTAVSDCRPKIRELIAPHVNRWGASDVGDLARAIRDTLDEK